MRTVLILLLMLTAPLTAYSQRYPCKIITLEGDTIVGEYKFNSGGKYLHKGEMLSRKQVTIKTDEGKQKFDAEEVAGYQIQLNSGWKTYYSVNYEGGKYQFMKQVSDGRLKVYSATLFDNGDVQYETRYCIVKPFNSGTLYILSGAANTATKVGSFLSDCPAASVLATTQQSSLANESGWISIARTYDENC